MALLQRMDQRSKAGPSDDPFNPDTIEESSPPPRTDKKRSSSSPASNSDASHSNSDASHHGDRVSNEARAGCEDGTAQGEQFMQLTTRKKRKISDDALALRAFVANQKEYKDLSKAGFEEAVREMIMEVGLKMHGRGLEILFENGNMSDFCNTIAELNGNHHTDVKKSKMKMVKKWKEQSIASEYFTYKDGEALRPSNIKLTVKGKHNLLMHIDTDQDDLSHKIETICRNEASDVLTKLYQFSRALRSQVQIAQECRVVKNQVHEKSKEQFRQQKKILCDKEGMTESKAMNKLRAANQHLYQGLFPQKTDAEGKPMFRKDGQTPVNYTAVEMAQEATGKSKKQIYSKGLTAQANEPVFHALLLQRSAMTYRMSAQNQDYLTAAKEVGASQGIDMMALCGLDKADPDSRTKLARLSFDRVTGIEHFGKQQQQQQQLQLMDV